MLCILKWRHLGRQMFQLCKGMFHLDTHVFSLKLIPSGMFGKGKRHVFPTKHSHSGRDQHSHLIRQMTRKSVWKRSYFTNFNGWCVRFVHELSLQSFT